MSYNDPVVAPGLAAPWRPWAAALALAAFLTVGVIGVYRYIDNYWVYRGFAPPKDAPWVKAKGTSTRFYVASPALGGRSQPVDVYLPPGYATHPHRRYPVLYLLHGIPGRPGAFVDTVRMGVVEDELVALHRAQPLILVMPFGSTGSFTDEEWANGIAKHSAWETFLARDVVRAVDARYRTIRKGWARGLAGLSEGGYGALNIGIHHPGEFKVLESWSGYQTAERIPSIFGKRRDQLVRNSPLDTLPPAARALRRAHTYVWFYSGKKDHFLSQNKEFAVLLAKLRLPYRFFEVRGGHNWSLWRDNAWRAYMTAARRLHAP